MRWFHGVRMRDYCNPVIGPLQFLQRDVSSSVSVFIDPWWLQVLFCNTHDLVPLSKQAILLELVFSKSHPIVSLACLTMLGSTFSRDPHAIFDSASTYVSSYGCVVLLPRRICNTGRRSASSERTSDDACRGKLQIRTAYTSRWSALLTKFCSHFVAKDSGVQS